MKKILITLNVLLLTLTACGAGVDSNNLTPGSVSSTYVNARVTNDADTKQVLDEVVYSLNAPCPIGINCTTINVYGNDYIKINGTPALETKGIDGSYTYKFKEVYNPNSVISTSYKGEKFDFTNIFSQDNTFYYPTSFNYDAKTMLCNMTVTNKNGDTPSQVDLDRMNLRIDNNSIYAKIIEVSKQEKLYAFDCSQKNNPSLVITGNSSIRAINYVNTTYQATANGLKIMSYYTYKSKSIQSTQSQ